MHFWTAAILIHWYLILPSRPGRRLRLRPVQNLIVGAIFTRLNKQLLICCKCIFTLLSINTKDTAEYRHTPPCLWKMRHGFATNIFFPSLLFSCAVMRLCILCPKPGCSCFASSCRVNSGQKRRNEGGNVLHCTKPAAFDPSIPPTHAHTRAHAHPATAWAAVNAHVG